jgi:hypothetical protein
MIVKSMELSGRNDNTGGRLLGRTFHLLLLLLLLLLL